MLLAVSISSAASLFLYLYSAYGLFCLSVCIKIFLKNLVQLCEFWSAGIGTTFAGALATLYLTMERYTIQECVEIVKINASFGKISVRCV